MTKENNPISSTRDIHLPKEKIKINASIFVVSDSLSVVKGNWRNKDKSGLIAENLLNENEIEIKKISVLPDNLEQIRSSVNIEVNQQTNIILTIGGTGITQKDVTFEALHPMLDKELSGFGELFRSETYKQVGSISILSRAFAGISSRTLVISLPGSPNAVKLG